MPKNVSSDQQINSLHANGGSHGAHKSEWFGLLTPARDGKTYRVNIHRVASWTTAGSKHFSLINHPWFHLPDDPVTDANAACSRIDQGVIYQNTGQRLPMLLKMRGKWSIHTDVYPDKRSLGRINVTYEVGHGLTIPPVKV